jgi:hypothetical protein
MSEAGTTAILIADIDYISVKRHLLVWFDLIDRPKEWCCHQIATTRPK